MTTSIGTRVMAASNSSEFEAAATTCKPRSLRRASASNWVWMRVLSATTILTKSEPRSSWDGIGPPDNWLYKREGDSVRKYLLCRYQGLWGRLKKARRVGQSFLLQVKMYH